MQGSSGSGARIAWGQRGSPAEPATVQAPRRRRSDLNLGTQAPKRNKIPTCTDPDHLVSRGYKFFDVKVVKTKNPTTNQPSDNGAFVINEAGDEDYRAKEMRIQQLERFMGGETIGGCARRA